MKKIFVVSHCILNTASKVHQDESGLQEEYKLRRQFLHMALEQNIQLLQLPCPEFILYGSRRWGHVRSQFEHPMFRKSCVELFEPVLMQLQEYASDPLDFSVQGIVSVEGSPSCGFTQTCLADWGGEQADWDHSGKQLPPVRMVNEPGVFMEIVARSLRENSLDIPILTLQQAVDLLCDNL